jgi:hypothetical protein
MNDFRALGRPSIILNLLLATGNILKNSSAQSFSTKPTSMGKMERGIGEGVVFFFSFKTNPPWPCAVD